MAKKIVKSKIKVTYSYKPVSNEEEEWRLKKLFELLLEVDMRSLEKLKKGQIKD